MKEKLRRDFISLLSTQNPTRLCKWSIVKKAIEDDDRCKAIDRSSTREFLFYEFQGKFSEEANSDIGEIIDRQRRIAAEAAIQKCKKEMQTELGDQLKKRTKEHEKHKYQENEESFKALLVDLIRSTDYSWHEARCILRNDTRFEDCNLFDKVKEGLFDAHIQSLEKRRREHFLQLLNETKDILPILGWRETKNFLEKEDRFSKFPTDDCKVECNYEDWIEAREETVLKDFKGLLEETKIITYKSLKAIQDNEQHLRDLLASLENDKRYIVLKESPVDGDRLLEQYLEELDKKGPPPRPA